MKHFKKYSTILIGINLLAANIALADNITINNNNAQPAPQQSNNNNNSSCVSSGPPDPRIAPEGTYSYSNGDGSGEQVYTTGEKRPYIVDPCPNNSTTAPIVQPNIYPPRPPRH